MFTNSANIQRLSNAFALISRGDVTSLSQGEGELKVLQCDTSYPILLFDFMQSQGNNPAVNQQAAIQFKHWCQSYVGKDEYEVNCLQETMQQIRQNIIAFYMVSGHSIANQLEDAIICIAKKDFSERWQTLLTELIQYCDLNLPSDQALQNTFRTLKVFKRLFEKYEYSVRSDPLYEEIIYVCNVTHNFLLSLTQSVMAQLVNGQDSGPVTVGKLKILKTLMRIFYYLNFQDLHPSFEDNIANWMKLHQDMFRLQLDLQKLQGSDHVLFKCKGESMRCILLYVQKYREDFQSLIHGFSQEIWQMCTITNEDAKFDKIVLNALRYFKNLVLWNDMRGFFESNIATLMTNLVVPNLGLSQNDSFKFTDEPAIFVETFFDQADTSSRRAVTVDLLRIISRYYQPQLKQFIEDVVPKYKSQLDASGGIADQAQEITLLNLVIDGSLQAYRPKDGVSELTLPADLITYIYNNIIKVSLAQLYQHLVTVPAAGGNIATVEQKFAPIFVTFYLRFFFYYRHYLPREELMELAKAVSYCTKTSSETLRMVACYTIEALLTVKDGDIKNYINVVPHFNKGNVEPQLKYILLNLQELSAAQNEIDFYLVRCLLAMLRVLDDGVSGYVENFCLLLHNQLQKFQNGYDFQKAHTIFECIGILIQYAAAGNTLQVSVIERHLQDELNTIISKNMTDLLAFVLQIYGLFVRCNATISSNYQSIFNSLLALSNWRDDNSSLFPAYIVYIEAYASKDANIFLQNQAAFQQIMLTTLQLKLDQTFFQLADLAVNLLNLPVLRQSGWLHFLITQSFAFYQDILKNHQNLAAEKGRRKSSKPSFVKQFIYFTSKLIVMHSAADILQDFDCVQPGILQNFLVEEVQLVRSIQVRIERKIIFVALTDLLLRCTQTMSIENWAKLLNGMIDNCANKMRFTKSVGGQVLFAWNKENHGGTINDADSGFQKLFVLKDDSRVKLAKDIDNEDKYFGKQFNDFYQNPQVQSSFNFQQLITPKNQEILTKLIEEGLNP